MKKIISFIILSFIVLFLSSCSLKERWNFRNFLHEYNIKHISYKNIEYSYSHVTGFEDRIGIRYYFLSFDEYSLEFIDQFENSDYKFIEGKNILYEQNLMDKIESFINDSYYEIEEEYAIDFDKEYMYSEFPMIFYEDTNDLIIIEFVDIR